MDTDAKIQYDHYLKHIRVSKDMLDTAMEKGKLDGRKEMILSFFDIGIDIPQISQAANMSEDEIKNFLQENGREISS